ncbi:MAG: glutamine--fructose-6-phosphate aminotransferase [Acidobacteria bacterium RIFCSPLOWO2_12_FULL_54_10]|nr:MAG: glutamine--fructose-6-phosphate aminotransferase [Acidobacteria bacterium RIFCSPLOWO2_12_FULL_54_10]
MCGIVGYIGPKPVSDVLLEGLQRLEYRGYDSAGIAIGNPQGSIDIRRASGKLINLEQAVRQQPISGTYGIGHTRWATHGRPTEENAHPHRDCRGEVVVVHNGIVENYLPLKRKLTEEGHRFVTETDTEIIAHLIEKHMHADHMLPLEEAVRRTVAELRGVFAVVAITSRDPGKIVAARSGPPIVIGLGDKEFFVASDIPAILFHTRDMLFLADGDMAVITSSGVNLTDLEGHAIQRDPQHVTWDPVQAQKGGYKHFMLKEIFEQPQALRDTVLGRIHPGTGEVTLDDWGFTREEFASIQQVKILACGTSWHAGLAGKYMIESLARLPVEVDYASEFRYRDPIVGPESLTVVITQSGETADTLAAQRESKQKGSKTLAICNVVGSMVTREAAGTLYTHAGPEIGVASTKAFTSQLTALFLLSLYLGQIRGKVTASESMALAQELNQLSDKLRKVLNLNRKMEELAKTFFKSQNFLYLGRGIHYPIALEGALKLKEISYIHAEGYPAGEMKHGPIALIDEELPIVVIATRQPGNASSEMAYEKILSNIKEVKAREGVVIALVTAGDRDVKESADHVIEIPASNELLAPILEVVPLQLLAYHIAVRRGCDVDQPRNLAKSVTVE